MPIPAQAICTRERGVTAGRRLALTVRSHEKTARLLDTTVDGERTRMSLLQISYQCCESSHVREYAVLPALVFARLLVSLLGDFHLFVSDSAQYCLGRDCSVTVLV
jgi:hypothetical protein